MKGKSVSLARFEPAENAEVIEEKATEEWNNGIMEWREK